MKTTLVALLLLAFPAAAQMGPFTDKVKSCADCGVVSVIRPVVKEQRMVSSEAAPSGLVARIPLGSSAPAQVGSSTRFGKDAVSSETTYEFVVRLDDGRFRLVRAEERGDWREGDRARVEEGRLLRP